MAEIGVRDRLLVKDVMSSPAITVSGDDSVNKVAQLMDQYKIGCVIVTDENGNPLGMITERDLVLRVLVKNAQPSKIDAKKVMSSPLITVDPDLSITEAARIMSSRDVRRLGILYKGTLVGIVSSKDILAVTPELIEIMQERARIEGFIENDIQSPPLAGHCDQCGRWSDTLKETNGNFLCDECRVEFGNEY